MSDLRERCRGFDHGCLCVGECGHTDALLAFVEREVAAERERCASFLDRYAAIGEEVRTPPDEPLSPILKRYAAEIRKGGGA